MTTVRAARLLLVFLLASCATGFAAPAGHESGRGASAEKSSSRDVKNVSIDRADLSAHLHEQMEKSTPYSLDDWGTRPARAAARRRQTPTRQGVVPKLLSLYESQVLAFYDPHVAHVLLDQAAAETARAGGQARRSEDARRDGDGARAHARAAGSALQARREREGAHARHRRQPRLSRRARRRGRAGHGRAHARARAARSRRGRQGRRHAGHDHLRRAGRADDRSVHAEVLRRDAEVPLPRRAEVRRRRVPARRMERARPLHANPPRTTREILHPDEYFSRTFKPQPFDATKPADAISPSSTSASSTGASSSARTTRAAG